MQTVITQRDNVPITLDEIAEMNLDLHFVAVHWTKLSGSRRGVVVTRYGENPLASSSGSKKR